MHSPEDLVKKVCFVKRSLIAIDNHSILLCNYSLHNHLVNNRNHRKYVCIIFTSVSVNWFGYSKYEISTTNKYYELSKPDI